MNRSTVLLLLALGSTTDALAQPPAKANLGIAVGEVSTQAGETVTVSFVWNAAATATWYRLWIDDAVANVKTEWVSAAAAQCDGGRLVCSASLILPWASGHLRWWVLPWSPPNNTGPWSAEHRVEVAGAYRSSATSGNTFVGNDAGVTTTLGVRNTGLAAGGIGSPTGTDNTAIAGGAAGSQNTALGYLSLRDNVTGTANTAVGELALSNTLFSTSTAIGFQAGANNTSGGHVSIGSNAFYLTNTQSSLSVLVGESAGTLSNGYNNIYLGHRGVANENNTIRIGVAHTAAYLAGVSGATSGSGSQAYVSTAGQLGTMTSSIRFKRDVAGVGDESLLLHRLRPVRFTYRLDPGQTPQYGLIAEEVADVRPDWVLENADGEIETVRYEMLVPLLLKEVQRARDTLKNGTVQLSELRRRVAAFGRREEAAR